MDMDVFKDVARKHRDKPLVDGMICEITTLRQQLKTAQTENECLSASCLAASEKLAQYKADADHKQSIIDRLMLEYCPNEMTPEQIKTWAENQVPVSADELAAIDSAMGKEAK